VLGPDLSGEEVKVLLKAQYKRTWSFSSAASCRKRSSCAMREGIFVGTIAEYRLQRVSDREVEYLAKDTRKKLLVKQALFQMRNLSTL